MLNDFLNVFGTDLSDGVPYSWTELAWWIFILNF